MKTSLSFLFISLSALAASRGADAIGVGKGDRVLNFTVGGQPMFTYQMEAGPLPEGVPASYAHGAYLHPVFSPGGKLVTADFPPDHRHQRGIFFAWTKTEFEGRHPDFWNMGKGDQPDGKLQSEVRFASLEKSWGGAESGGFVSRHRFIDHSGEASKDTLNETWEVTARRVVADGRMANVIDLVSTQTCASSSPVVLPKYHYGGLGVRGSAQWDPVNAVTMLTSNGDDRAKGDATKAKWVHIGGDVDGAPAGIAVLIHPSNFRFPQPLRLNPKNPQLCVAPSADGDWSIEPGKPYVSRYRIVVFDGAADAAWIGKRLQDYAKPVTAAVGGK
ncbi:MAG: PmoA family protein [Chthoniobacteraceae bacterium]